MKQALLQASSQSTTIKERIRTIWLRDGAIKKYARERARGFCEACRKPAPFITVDDRSYLEVHHLKRLSDG